jgi:hypothetical protein
MFPFPRDCRVSGAVSPGNGPTLRCPVSVSTAVRVTVREFKRSARRACADFKPICSTNLAGSSSAMTCSEGGSRRSVDSRRETGETSDCSANCRDRWSAGRRRRGKRVDCRKRTISHLLRRPVGSQPRSRSRLRITNPTLAGRSPSRRMKYGNHWCPNGT